MNSCVSPQSRCKHLFVACPALHCHAQAKLASLNPFRRGRWVGYTQAGSTHTRPKRLISFCSNCSNSHYLKFLNQWSQVSSLLYHILCLPSSTLRGWTKFHLLALDHTLPTSGHCEPRIVVTHSACVVLGRKWGLKEVRPISTFSGSPSPGSPQLTGHRSESKKQNRCYFCARLRSSDYFIDGVMIRNLLTYWHKPHWN